MKGTHCNKKRSALPVGRSACAKNGVGDIFKESDVIELGGNGWTQKKGNIELYEFLGRCRKQYRGGEALKKSKHIASTVTGVMPLKKCQRLNKLSVTS